MLSQAKPIGPQTKYTQLRDSLLSAIASGEYPPGSRLPSLQKIMSSCRVSQATAVRAIEMLANEGVLERRPGVGVFVTEAAARRGPGLTMTMGNVPRLLHQALALNVIPVESGASPGSEIPDIRHVIPLSCVDFLRRQQIICLDPFLEEDPAFTGSLEPAALRAYQHGDGTFAIPAYISPLCTHINLDAFESAGVAPPPPDWDWPRFEAIAGEFRRANVARPLAWSARTCYLFPFIYAEGAKPYSPETGAVSLDTPVVAKALKKLRRLADIAGPPSEGSISSMREPFGAGRSPMLFWGDVGAGMSLPFRHSVLPLPGGERVRTTVLSDGLAISSSCQSPELAWKVIKQFAGAEASELLLRKKIMFPPTRQGILNFLRRNDDSYLSAYRSLCGALWEHLGLGLEGTLILDKALSGWWREEVDLENRLALAQAAMDAVMAATSTPLDYLDHA